MIFADSIQCSVHSPPSFVQNHWSQLLPEWTEPVHAVLIVLQRCPRTLQERDLATEVQKDLFREQFLQMGDSIVKSLQAMHHLADLFDPRTGQPLRSAPGALRLDDVAVVRSLLGYPSCRQGHCAMVLHPLWGAAVYPSVLVASAPPDLVEQVARQQIVLEHA